MPTTLRKWIVSVFLLLALTAANAQNPLAPALGFQVFSETNVQMKGGTTEGALAAGSNFEVAGNAQYNGSNSSGIGRSYVTIGANTYSLIANGSYVATSGSFFVNSTNRWIKFGNLNGAVSGTNNRNQLRVTRNNVYVHVNSTQQLFSQVAGAGLVDFTTAFNNLRSNSIGLAACANTGVSISTIGTISRIGLSNGKNVWNVTGAQLNNISILSFATSPSSTRPLIINVNAAGTYTLKMPTFSGISVSQAPYIIFNFYNTTVLNYTGSNGLGSILAPNAAFAKTGSQTIAGQIIVKNFSQSAGNLQYAPFNTNAAVCVTCLTATSAGANQTQCDNTVFNLQATVAPAGASGKWSVVSGTAVIGNLDANTTTATITGTRATLRWTVSKSGCPNVSADVVLTNTQLVANAGPNLRNCNSSNFVLQASNPGAGISGLWSVTSGSATIANTAAYNSAVVLQSDSAQLAWTISQNGCSASASVQIKNSKWSANAGSDQDSRCNGNTLTLQATSPDGTSGVWSLVSGKAIIANPQSANSSVEVTQSPAVLRWTLTDGFCTANDLVQVSVAQPYKIVVLGSSTAAGVGASVADSAWVAKLSKYFNELNSNSQVVNLGVPGYDSYQVLCPTGFSPPSNRPAPDGAHNITAALQYQPDAIIINLPTNDIANGYSLEEQKQNFERTIALANRAHVRVWVTNAQPRNAFNAEQVAKLLEQRDWVNQKFGDFAIDFWTTIADANNKIDPAYNADDIHVNDAGHQIFYSRVLSKNIPNIVCQPWQNKIPVAFAGNNQFIGNPSQVTLNGSGSYDADGVITSYNWRQVSGTALLINNATSANATVNIPQGIYSFELTVTDDEGATSKDTVTLTITTRILIDAGSIELTPAPDANGKYWNNLSDGKTGFELPSLVTTTNVATGVKLTILNRIDGTYAVNANGLYGYNTVGQVGDYPASATSDYAFAHTSTTAGKWGFSGLEADKKYDFKFWGTKDADSRWIEIKLEGDTVWHSYDAGRNNNYEQAIYISVSGVTTANFEIRVKAGSSFGYLSVIDIAVQPLVEEPLSNLPPIANAGQDQIQNISVTNATLTGTNSTDIDGSVVGYNWRQIGGYPVQINNSNNVVATVSGLQEGVFTFELTVTDDEAASSVDTVRITLGKRVLLDFGNIDLTNSPDVNGRYWNNIQSGITGTTVANLINAENEPTAIGFEIPARIDGTFSETANGLYGYNTIGAVGEYPVSTTSDYAFAHTSTTEGQWKLTNLDATKQYTVKFWGTKDASSRWIEIRLLGTENWQTYDAGFNNDFNRAASFTFSGLTEAVFEIRVKAGSSFGYINVVDISITLPESQTISSRGINRNAQKANSNIQLLSNNKNNVTVFPNPSYGNFTVKFGQEFTNAETLAVKLETISGQMVYSTQVNANNGLVTVNPSVHPKPGLYVVRIVGKQKAIVQTIVIR